jgi:hypothetical protein
VRDSEDDNFFAMRLIDYGIWKFSDYEASSFGIEPGPTQRILRDQTDSTIDFSFEIGSQSHAARIIPGQGGRIVF